MKILSIRQRATGAEIVVLDSNREYTLWFKGYDLGDTDTPALEKWALTVLGELRAIEDATSAEREAEVTDTVVEVSKSDFYDWVIANINRPDVQKALAPLVQAKKSEDAK